MNVVIVNQDEVPGLLPMAECIGVMEKVLRGLAAGECMLPLRQIMAELAKCWLVIVPGERRRTTSRSLSQSDWPSRI